MTFHYICQIKHTDYENKMLFHHGIDRNDAGLQFIVGSDRKRI